MSVAPEIPGVGPCYCGACIGEGKGGETVRGRVTTDFREGNVQRFRTFGHQGGSCTMYWSMYSRSFGGLRGEGAPRPTTVRGWSTVLRPKERTNRRATPICCALLCYCTAARRSTDRLGTASARRERTARSNTGTGATFSSTRQSTRRRIFSRRFRREDRVEHKHRAIEETCQTRPYRNQEITHTPGIQ